MKHERGTKRQIFEEEDKNISFLHVVYDKLFFTKKPTSIVQYGVQVMVYISLKTCLKKLAPV